MQRFDGPNYGFIWLQSMAARGSSRGLGNKTGESLYFRSIHSIFIICLFVGTCRSAASYRYDSRRVLTNPVPAKWLAYAFVSFIPCIRISGHANRFCPTFGPVRHPILRDALYRLPLILLERRAGFRGDCDILTCVANVSASLFALNAGDFSMMSLGFLLLLAGWLLALAAIVLFAPLPLRTAFVLAGIVVEALGLILAFRSHLIPREEKR